VTKLPTASWPRSIVSLALLAALAPGAAAQDPKLPSVEQLRVGLPFGLGDPESGRYRRGAWAPVYLKLKAGNQPIVADSLRVVVESSDAEDNAYQYATPLPFVDAEKDYFAISYARPGSTEVNVSLQSADGKRAPFLVRAPDGRMVSTTRLTRDFSREDIGPANTLYLAIGSRLPGLGRSLAAVPPGEAPDQDPRDDRGLRKLTFLDNIDDLPDRWYGYDAIDIVVLTTASDSFVRALSDPAAAPRRRALGEWVRRGGKLIVSVGRNRQQVADLLDQIPLSEFDKQPLINCKIDGAIVPKAGEKGEKGAPALPLRVLTRWAVTEHDLEIAELTRLRPNLPDTSPKAEPVTVLIREAPRDDEKDGPPVVVHAACGLGRVVLVGLDLDAAPFSNWPGQKTVWEKLENELDPRNAAGHREAQFIGRGQSDEIDGELKRALESFKEVPVISFGWVALFILVYIVIVGPLDYLILKKVFKRLELTWITFPTVVLGISVAAYFTAYSLKGDDLRINKIDVYDLDLHGTAPQAYGSTWVTLFSPRIQNYTIGIEPTAPPAGQSQGPAWVATPAADARTPRSVVTVMEGDVSGIGRVGSQGLFRRAYEYAPNASGLEGVSIPVWSMRTFTARWRAPVTGAVGIEADLRHSRDKNDPGLLGRITNHLPVELRDVTLLYQGKTYAADVIPPEGFIAIDNLKVGEQGRPVPQWLTDGAALADRGDRTVTGPQLIRDLLFHGPPAQPSKPNGGWRQLDQAWRLRGLAELSSAPVSQLDYRNEVILAARVPSRAGASETVMRADASPTRLWLGALPGGGQERPSLSGFIVQDVYVRVYIPVNP
jgi:hypothetical protein